MKLKIFDYFFIVLTLVVITAASVSAYSGGGAAESVIIDVSSETYVYMADTDRTVEIPGPLGDTTVQITDSEVQVLDSPCRDKLCIQAAPLQTAGDWNACMPNQVFIRISESQNQEMDTLSY